MSKTFKDLKKNKENRKPKEGRRFESSKGRKKQTNLKNLIRDNRSLDDYFI